MQNAYGEPELVPVLPPPNREVILVDDELHPSYSPLRVNQTARGEREARIVRFNSSGAETNYKSGLENGGLFCFFNSLMQCLRHSHYLTK